MVKLYISQPMKGKTSEEIKTERAKIINLAKEKLGGEFEIIDTYFEQEFRQNENTPLWFLGKQYSVWQVRMWCISVMDGKKAEDVKLNINVLKNTGL